MKRYVVNIRQWPRTAARRARMKTEQSTRKPLKTPAHAAPVGRRYQLHRSVPRPAALRRGCTAVALRTPTARTPLDLLNPVLDLLNPQMINPQMINP